LLCGMVRLMGERARGVAAHAGLRSEHLTDLRARDFWDGKRDVHYQWRVFWLALAEHERVLERCARERDRRVLGLRDDLYQLPSDDEMVEELAVRLVRLAAARGMLAQAERIAKGLAPMSVTGGVQI